MDIKIGDYVELVVSHTDPALEYASGPFLVQDIRNTPYCPTSHMPMRGIEYLLLFPEGPEWVELAQAGLSLRLWKKHDPEIPPEAEEPTHNTLFDFLLAASIPGSTPSPPPPEEADFHPGGGDYGGGGATVAYEEPSPSESEPTSEGSDSSTSDAA